jgi:hypothetical protein
MIFYFLISCYTTPDRTICTQTQVPNVEVCHALIDATNSLANEKQNPGGVNYYPAFRCVRIRQKS